MVVKQQKQAVTMLLSRSLRQKRALFHIPAPQLLPLAPPPRLLLLLPPPPPLVAPQN